jgi:hypothetical protein
MNTVDREAINSEESEEECPLKMIYDWKRDVVHNKNIAISRKSDSSPGFIGKSDEKIKKSMWKNLKGYGRNLHYSSNLKNDDLFEILNSDKEGISENNKVEVKNQKPKILKSNAKEESKYLMKKGRRELESSEDDYSDGENTLYYQSIQEKVKRLRSNIDTLPNNDEEEIKTSGTLIAS